MLRLRGKIPRDQKWDVVVDLFFYRDPEEAEKEEAAAKELMPAAKVETAPDASEPVEDDMGAATVPAPGAAPIVAAAAEDWNEEEPTQANWGGGVAF